jgi:hypothetical protein
MLTQKEIIPYLLRQRLLNTKQIVEGDFIVKDTSQRNCNFAVISHLGPCYLLKQGVGTKRIATVAHEAAIYQLLQNELKTHPFSRYLPRFYEYNSTEHILILELVDTAQNLRQYHSRQGRFPKNLAQSTGQALATLHHLNNMEECQKILNKSLPTLMHEVPWIFSLHYPHLRLFREISSANLQLIKIIQ